MLTTLALVWIQSPATKRFGTAVGPLGRLAQVPTVCTVSGSALRTRPSAPQLIAGSRNQECTFASTSARSNLPNRCFNVDHTSSKISSRVHCFADLPTVVMPTPSQLEMSTEMMSATSPPPNSLAMSLFQSCACDTALSVHG